MTLFNSAIDKEPWIEHAISEIHNTYGHKVSVGLKAKSLVKFGRNEDLDSEETVWLIGGEETLPTTNAIDTLVSTDAGDDQDVTIEGHTIDGSGNLTFVTQNLTVNGTTDVSLTTNLARATRIINIGTTNFAGTVTVRQDGGNTHLSTSGSTNQSLKCATSISQYDYWILTGLTASVNRQSNASVDFRLQVAPVGGVYNTKFIVSVHSNGGSVHLPFKPCLIVPPNSDVRVNAIPSASNVNVEAAIHGVLASIV